MFNLQARLASICWKHVFAVHPHLKSSVGKLGKQEPFALLSVSLQKKGFGGFEVRSQPIEKVIRHDVFVYDYYSCIFFSCIVIDHYHTAPL